MQIHVFFKLRFVFINANYEDGTKVFEFQFKPVWGLDKPPKNELNYLRICIQNIKENLKKKKKKL